MDGATFHERLNIQLHNRGDEYVIPNPFWKPEELALRAQSSLNTVYTTLLDMARLKGQPCHCLNRMIKSTVATAGTNVPDDFYQIIIGRKTSGAYVNADPMPIAASSAGYDTVWTSGGKFRGTADTAFYYARPLGPVNPSDIDVTYFPDGFYDAVITHTARETVKSEAQDSLDRITLLDELLYSQLESLF